MRIALLAFVAISLANAQPTAQTEKNPPVVAQMEELGTVYLTRSTLTAEEKKQGKESVIIGVDFRPTAGTDPKKIAAAVKELKDLPDLETVLLLGMDVNDEATEALPGNGKLKSIQFFNTNVTDKGIA